MAAGEEEKKGERTPPPVRLLEKEEKEMEEVNNRHIRRNNWTAVAVAAVVEMWRRRLEVEVVDRPLATATTTTTPATAPPPPPPDTAAAALTLANASRAIAFRGGEDKRSDDDVVLCQPVGGDYYSSASVLGCKHYARKVRLVAACCGAAHVCRFCHDEAEDHTIDRYATREMVCMVCSARQPPAKECRECGVLVARYFCSVCNFWDDSADHDVYHCPFCNVCRRGRGWGDFFHCMQCNSCVSLTMGRTSAPRPKATPTEAGGLESDCPVCKDFLFTSDTPVSACPGHFMHTACFESYTKHYYTCPICRKSLGDFSAYCDVGTPSWPRRKRWPRNMTTRAGEAAATATVTEVVTSQRPHQGEKQSVV